MGKAIEWKRTYPSPCNQNVNVPCLPLHGEGDRMETTIGRTDWFLPSRPSSSWGRRSNGNILRRNITAAHKQSLPLHGEGDRMETRQRGSAGFHRPNGSFLFMGKAIEWKPDEVIESLRGKYRLAFLFMGKAIEWKRRTSMHVHYNAHDNLPLHGEGDRMETTIYGVVERGRTLPSSSWGRRSNGNTSRFRSPYLGGIPPPSSS